MGNCCPPSHKIKSVMIMTGFDLQFGVLSYDSSSNIYNSPNVQFTNEKKIINIYYKNERILQNISVSDNESILLNLQSFIDNKTMTRKIHGDKHHYFFIKDDKLITTDDYKNYYNKSDGKPINIQPYSLKYSKALTTATGDEINAVIYLNFKKISLPDPELI